RIIKAYRNQKSHKEPPLSNCGRVKHKDNLQIRKNTNKMLMAADDHKHNCFIVSNPTRKFN
ncbi:hypothetical protein GIB67_004500, partial [Kingdonia uniflora]